MNRDMANQSKIANKAVKEDIAYRNSLAEALFKNSTDAIVFFDENNIIVDINNSFQDLFGYTLREIKGLDVDDALDMGKPNSADRNISKLASAGKKVIAEGTRYAKHGDPIEVAIKGIPIFVNNIYSGGYAIYTDITERKQAAKILEERERQLYSLLNNVPGLVYRCHNDRNWTMIFISNGSYELTGYEPEELINNQVLSYNDLILPEYQPVVWKNWQNRILNKLSYEDEYPIKTASGTIKWVWERGNGVYDEQGNLQFLEGFITDVTKRKLTEEALIKSEEKYREILSTMQEGYYETDLKGKVIFCNDSLCKQLGYSRSELMNLSYKDYYRYPEKLFNTFKKVYSTGIAVKSADWTIITKKGKEKSIEISVSLLNNEQGKAIGFRGVGRDITERKQTEDALQRSEEKYREILSSIDDGFFEVDLKGNITLCNNAAAKMLKYSVGEFVGMNYTNFCKDPHFIFNAFNKAFRTGKTQHVQTFEMIKKDGIIAHGELSLSLAHDKDGNLIGFRGVGRDVTERILYEKQLKYLSLHDQLTGLYNRAYFEDELERLGSGRDYPITILSIDLDGLKLINDTIGHEQGDQLLINCAQVIKRSLRGTDIFARVGGDEFVALLPKTGEKTGEKLIKRIQSGIDTYNKQEPDQIPLSISIGLSTANNTGEPLHNVFKEADDLMYRAKLHKGVDARSQIIMSLLAALGERDYITEGHARRLEALCHNVGKELSLSGKQLSNLTLLSQVHDLGKVGIPDSILYKKGPLTADEWQVMRQHSEKGYRIALSSTDLSGITDLILKHHERWDGSGYPLGIKGEDIPIECRILAIADAYDAMVNDRPYSKAMPAKNAIKELKKNAATQFDPSLVELFILILEEKYSVHND